MLWPGMCFSLRSQCKRCSAGRLHNSLSWKSFEPFVLNETKPTYRGSYATCTPWLRTHILHHDVPRISTIFILLRLNPLSQRKLPIVISLSRMLCFGRVCASPCALNVSAALQGAYMWRCSSSRPSSEFVTFTWFVALPAFFIHFMKSQPKW